MRLKVKYLIILWHVIAGVCEMLTSRSVLSWLARDVHAHAYTAVMVAGFALPIPCSTIQLPHCKPTNLHISLELHQHYNTLTPTCFGPHYPVHLLVYRTAMIQKHIICKILTKVMKEAK